MGRGTVVTGLVAAAAALAVGAAAAAPPGPPPKVSGAKVAPPAAWIEVGATQKWLAYSSYCWKTACVDFLPPAMRTDVPRVTVRRGQTVRIHFGFAPKTVGVTMVKPAGLAKTQGLKAARTTSWRPRASGIAMVVAKPKTGGDASYLVRIRLR